MIRIQHLNYHSACVDLGLARGDRKWIDCTEKVSVLNLPKSLQVMFCNILINFSPQSLLLLLDRFSEIMAEDFISIREKTPNNTEEEAQS